MRKINIPGDLVSYFLRLASENTRKDLETCGILTGRLVSEFISLVMVMGLSTFLESNWASDLKLQVYLPLNCLT